MERGQGLDDISLALASQIVREYMYSPCLVEWLGFS